jgi:hypothetical protein
MLFFLLPKFFKYIVKQNILGKTNIYTLQVVLFLHQQLILKIYRYRMGRHKKRPQNYIPTNYEQLKPAVFREQKTRKRTSDTRYSDLI